jgi:hypothetical protein
MNKKLILISIVLFILFLPFTLQTAQTGKSKTIKKEGASSVEKSKATKKGIAPGKLNSKIEQFLGVIMKAKSLDEVSRAFKAANFSEAEKKQIEKEIKKLPYSTKLRNLGKKAVASAKSKAQAKRGKALVASQQALQRQQRQTVNRLSLEARKLFTSIKARALPMAPSKPVPFEGGFSPSMRARMFSDQLHRGAEVQGDIDNVSPLPATVGEELTITGNDFGSTRGEVFILYEPTREAYPATEIRSWSDRSIQITIPDSVAPLVGESQKAFMVRVIPRGAEMGPVHDILIQPHPDRLRPEITRIAPGSVMPGQEVAILGQNFLTERPGSVEFVFGTERIPGEVADRDWEDTGIVARLPADVTGLVAMDGYVVVENHIGNRATARIRFEPILEEEWLVNEWEYDCWGLLGHKETVTHNPFRLRNQWRVVEAHLYETAMGWLGISTGSGGGCIEKRKPEEGSSSAAYRFEGWCNGFNIVWCDTSVKIIGPRDTNYR